MPGKTPIRSTQIHNKLLWEMQRVLLRVFAQSLARKLDGVGNGSLVPGAAMRTDGVVLCPPAFRQSHFEDSRTISLGRR